MVDSDIMLQVPVERTRRGDLRSCASEEDFKERRSMAYRCKARLAIAGWTTDAKIRGCASLEFVMAAPGKASTVTSTTMKMVTAALFTLTLGDTNLFPFLVTLVCMVSATDAIQQSDLERDMERDNFNYKMDQMEKQLYDFNKTLQNLLVSTAAGTRLPPRMWVRTRR